ncbi:MAG: GspE/PulE family protein [bacterium]
MLSQPQLENILLKTKSLSQEELNKILAETKRKDIPLESFLIGSRLFSEETLYKTMAGYFKLPFVNLADKSILPATLQLIPETIAQTHQIIAFENDGQKVKIATTEPKDLEIIEFINKKIDAPVELYLTTPASINEGLKKYHHGLRADFQNITGQTEGKAGAESEDLEKLAQDIPIIKVVDSLLENAIIEGASDIHIEPTEKAVLVRYRVDGILRKVMTLPKSSHAGITARIKILSNLKLDEHRLPQDGRFKMTTEEFNVSFRVSVLPTFDGEKVVMRILDEKMQIISLEQLGFQPEPLKVIQRNIDKPHGMILVTGPTGSGKTTTLYAILHTLNDPAVNICTIEDPIEYRMPGVNQSQVQPKIKYTFATGLRAFLRQDPDIIMVGEIRDNETADIAVNAAMTGHLVLSTLHTNDAVTTLPRLADMKIPPFLIATTTNVIIAQRLARKICSNCIQSYTLNEKTLIQLKEQIDVESVLATLRRQKAIADSDKDFKTLLFYRGKGCDKCDQSGYKGRIGLYEVLEVTDKITELLNKGASTVELNKAAKEQGMISILEDGLLKAKQGITSIEEILRVTKE